MLSSIRLTCSCFSTLLVWLSPWKRKKDRNSFWRRCPVVCLLIMVSMGWRAAFWLARVDGMVIIEVLKCYLHFITFNIKSFEILDRYLDCKLSALNIYRILCMAYMSISVSEIYHINIFLRLVKYFLKRTSYSLLYYLRIDNAWSWILISGGTRKPSISLEKKSW